MAHFSLKFHGPLAAILGAGLMLASPALARESLGIFGLWGAFRDPAAPVCYAIGQPDEVRGTSRFKPYASIGTWPKRKVRGQVHFRLSRRLSSEPAITLTVGARRFRLTGSGANAWARDARMDAAIIAAMRSAESMEIKAIDRDGNTIRDVYLLRGAATAMDAAAIGCAKTG